METPYILKEITEENILVLTINRPKALNAINKGVMDALGEIFSKRQPEHIVGVILQGSGTKAFAAGADIKEFADYEYDQAKALSQKGQRIYDKIEQYHVPVIALVRGFALGGGCELAMACHMRIGDETATFGQPEVKLGVLPGYGGTQRLTQLIGKAKAIEYLLTGNMITAADAHQLGLLNHVVEPEAVFNTCVSLLKKIGRMGPLAVETTIKATMLGPSQEGYDQEAHFFGETFQSDESTEGISAFLEKRKPKFR